MGYQSTVLVLGASSSLGTAVVLHALAKGYKVKAVFVSQDEADTFRGPFPHHTCHLRFSVIRELRDDAALLGATIDVDYIVHTALSVLGQTEREDEVSLKTAVEGVETILRVAAQRPAVKHVVITSVDSSVPDGLPALPTSEYHTHPDCAHPRWHQAADLPNPGSASTTSALGIERSVWEFVACCKPHYNITSVCFPCCAIDVPEDPETWGWANDGRSLRDRIRREGNEQPPGVDWLPPDLDKLAQLHVDCLTDPRAKKQRCLATEGVGCEEDIICWSQGEVREMRSEPQG